MATVLLLATDHDPNAKITRTWASHLRSALSSSHTCIFLDRSNVNPTNFNAHIANADSVIFYGHGEPDRIVGQHGIRPFYGTLTLVDKNTVTDFRGLPVYLVCCWALNDLGDAYANAYPNGAIVGYEAAFGFAAANDKPFETIVNQHAMQFANGVNIQNIKNDLFLAWDGLAVAFMNGPLKYSRDFIVAGFAAAANARWVSKKP